MTDEPNESLKPSPATTEMHPRRASSFRTVAERITGRATNLFASGLVLIMGILLGREMISIWTCRNNPNETVEQSIPTPGSAVRSSSRIVFGNHPGTMLRSEIQGDAAAAMDQLRRDCRTVAGKTWNSPMRLTKAMHPWLKMLSGSAPADRDPEKWVLHEMQQPLPMIAALEDRDASIDTPDGPSIEVEKGILCWGLAFPSDSKPVSKATAWNSFVFSPANALELSANAGFELPSGCEQLVAIEDESRFWTGFSSDLDAAELAARWDSHQAKGGWQATAGWQVTGHSWHRRYVQTAGKSVDIQFAIESPARILGFCLVTSIRG